MASIRSRLTASLEDKSVKVFKVGNRVGWNSEAGHVTGVIKAIHTKPFQLNGYTRHASEDRPQYEIKSDKTDHVAYHYASALHRISSSSESESETSLESHTKTYNGKKVKVHDNGTKVKFNYRSGGGEGTITGVHEMASTSSEVSYSIRPHHRHVSDSGSKEPAIIHRRGSKVSVIQSFSDKD